VLRWAGGTPLRAVLAGGLLLWAAVAALSLLANPLPWQRYYLVWIPVLALAAGYLVAAVVWWLRPKRQAR
jgi:general stress protein CsbA